MEDIDKIHIPMFITRQYWFCRYAIKCTHCLLWFILLLSLVIYVSAVDCDFGGIIKHIFVFLTMLLLFGVGRWSYFSVSFFSLHADSQKLEYLNLVSTYWCLVFACLIDALQAPEVFFPGCVSAWLILLMLLCMVIMPFLFINVTFFCEPSSA